MSSLRQDWGSAARRQWQALRTPVARFARVRFPQAVHRSRTLAESVRRPFRRGFSRELGDQSSSVVADMGGDSRTLLIAFGGLQGRLAMPAFEFFNSTRGIPVKRVFVRDLRQAWYHRGLSGEEATLMDVVDSLRELIARSEVERLVVIGNSAGGYAALVFGTLLGADTVVCFSPQTVLDLEVWREMKDARWEGELRPLVESKALDTHWTDLRSALPVARSKDTRYMVFFDTRERLDRLHAERLAGIAGVRLYRLGRGGHMVPLWLRKCGALERVMRQALSVDAQGATAAAGARER